jgi:4a-hydroxytetrahydrobiopterin dehydratase
MSKLGLNEIEEKLAEFKGWEYKDNQITKTFILKDFISVMNFVNEVANEAEGMNHHPDIFIYSWNNVAFTLSTHSEGGITDKDFELAEKIESLQKSYMF